MVLRADESLHALLLERIVPGTHPDPGEAPDVARVLRAIHVPAPGGLPPLRDTVQRRLTWASDEGRASKEKLAWAMTTVAELERTAPHGVLLHGDFDERNLLVCDRRGLCAIDPLPCVGDPAYDVAYWVHANRRSGRRARLDAIVAATGLPRERVRDWAGVVGVHG
jgi:streptomycin 6-kinase